MFAGDWSAVRKFPDSTGWSVSASALIPLVGWYTSRRRGGWKDHRQTQTCGGTHHTEHHAFSTGCLIRSVLRTDMVLGSLCSVVQPPERSRVYGRTDRFPPSQAVANSSQASIFGLFGMTATIVYGGTVVRSDRTARGGAFGRVVRVVAKATT